MLSRNKAQIIVFIFCCALSAHSQTDLGAKSSTASISGKVTIKEKGAAGITVGLRLEETSRAVRYKAVTDEEGKYKIINVPPGHYQVVAVAPALVAADTVGRGRTIIIGKDETVENVDIPLLRGGVITGKVTDSEGRPVIEEEVSLHPVEVPRGIYQLPMGVSTDDRGVYRIYGLPPGKYRVSAGTGDFLPRGRGGFYKLTFHPTAVDVSQASIIDVTEGSEATNVDITFGRIPVKYSAHGRILDGKTGQPLPNVRYGVKQFLNEQGGSYTTSGAQSNTAGEFKLENLSPGKYAVFILPSLDSDRRADWVHFEVIDRDITGLIVRTSTGASVSGVVVLEGTDDKALHAKLRELRLHVDVGGADSSGVGENPSNIGQDGSFRVGALAAGTLRFSLSNHGRFQIVRVERDGIVYPSGIRIKDGDQIAGVRVVLNYGSGTIRGAVKLEGGTQPPNSVLSVSFRKLGEDPQSFTSIPRATRVDARGQFFVEGLIPGTYEMTGAVYILGTRRAFRSSKQQVVVGDGVVTTVTLTVNMQSTPDRP